MAGSRYPSRPADWNSRQVSGEPPKKLVIITSGRVTSEPGPHTEQGGKPGDGGRGAEMGAVGATGNGVVGGEPVGTAVTSMQPQLSANKTPKSSQKSGVK